MKPVPIIEPLPQAVLDALCGLPNGDEVAKYRHHLLTGSKRFAGAMRRVERRDMAPRALAELWLWLVHLTIQGGSRGATTGASYGGTVGRYLAWSESEGFDFTQATVTHFDRWQRWLAITCRNEARWRRQQVQALRNFYDWRRSRGLAEANLAADMVAPVAKPKPPKKYTDDQLRGLFRAIDASGVRQIRDRSAVLLLLATGLRREELCTLQLQQLELTARRGVVRVQGKGAKERDVPFEGPVVDALHAWLNQRDNLPFDHDESAVYIALTGVTRGEPLSLRSFETMVAVHARAAKLRDWGVHRFRVTFATQLYDEGADIETIRHLMGHESIETTRRYLAVSERARRTRLSADRQHRVLGTKPTGQPLWLRLATGGMNSD